MLIPMLLLSSLNGTPQIDALHYFQGTWSCEGHFEPSMKPISSTMRFGGGEVSMAMQKHHDDHAPSNYHAIEIWGLAAEAGVYRATHSGFIKRYPLVYFARMGKGPMDVEKGARSRRTTRGVCLHAPNRSGNAR